MATATVPYDPEAIVPRTEIIRMLDEHKVPWKSWGTGTSKTLEDLFKYHEADRLYFRNGSSPRFTIDVHVAVVIVIHLNRKKWLELFEHSQKFADGFVLDRSHFNGIAETAKRSEKTMTESAQRCLAEELNFRKPSEYELTPCLGIEDREPMKSEKWPGITAVYHRHIFECTISRSLFDPEGYMEKEKNRTIYFKWRLRRQLKLKL